MNRPTNPVDTYAELVVSGKVPAGKYHRLSCQRHLNDRKRERTPGFPYEFRWADAERFLKFARKLKHYKGRQFAGQPFEPSESQVFRLGCVFGWRHVDNGYRRFTTAYNELTRKHGKSFEAAAVALYCTFFEKEPGSEGYCIATKEKQARIVFGDAKQLTKTTPALKQRIQINAANLHMASSQSKLEPLGSDSDTTDGLNPHLVIVDEFHAHKTRALIDVMESATGARVNPMFYQITTAGNDPVSPCGDQHDYATKILDGVLEDDASTLAFFAFIAHADPDDDPWDEKTWIKANPHWGISVDPDDMRKLAAKARKMPSAAAEFKQKRLNLWVNASAACLSVDGWKQGQSDWTEADMVGESCFVGVDLAKKVDLCSLSFVFPPTETRPTWRAIQRIWTPKDTLADRAHRDRAPYDVWADRGWLIPVDGVSIDSEVVRQEILAWRDRVQILQIGFDPWHADTPIKNLTKLDGFSEDDAIAVPQTYQGMSAACLRVQAEVLAGLIDARGCPVTAWSVSNAVGQNDGKENLMFVKGKSRGRIDPVISLTIGVSMAIRKEGEFGVFTGEIRSLGDFLGA